MNKVRDLQEKKLQTEKWKEDNKKDIHKRDWGKYPMTLAEHGCLIVLDMQCRVLALANGCNLSVLYGRLCGNCT